MLGREPVALRRDVEAIQIPYGEKLALPAGSEVTVYQVLGGNYTVLTDRGMLVRIDARDADALGETAQAPSGAGAVDGSNPESVGKAVWEQLKTCYDPEIPVNIYELGLIYQVEVDDDGSVVVMMTLTSPHCPVAQSLPREVEMKVRAVPGVTSARVLVVWDPPWNPSMMSEAAKLELGMM